MTTPNFRFALGDSVRLIAKDEIGVVVARAEHLGGQIKYLLQRVGGAAWANDEALEPAPAPAADRGAA